MKAHGERCRVSLLRKSALSRKMGLVHEVKAEGRDLPKCRARDPVYQLYVQPSNKSQGLF